MRTSLIETERIEHLILRSGEPDELLVTEAKLLIDPELRNKLQHQRTSYDLIRLYGREKLHREIQQIEIKLFSESKYTAFQTRIRALFK